MFLFSTPQSRPAEPANPVVSAIRDGAEKTGTGFDYLLKTAQRESGLAPEAKAKTSSATGLFQFIEQTWLSMVKQEGPKQGLGHLAGAISENDGGRLTVSDPAAREQILQLRTDPQVSAVMAGALTQKNREQLAGSLGREPHAGELYIAHVLGARGASDLIRAASSDPTRAAARDFPEAAQANRGIFFDKAGKARTAQEVYGVLVASHAQTAVAATTGVSANASAPASNGAGNPVEIAAALRPGRAKGLIGLFSTEGSRQPVSAAVANLWTSPRAGGTRLASLDEGSRYFPRAGSTERAVMNDAGPAATPSAQPSETRLVTAPLPPARPAELSAATAEATPRAKTRRAPLDLASFMTQRGVR